MDWISECWDIFVSRLTSDEVNVINSSARLLLSMVLGVMIGAERKRKGQVAGIRTFALISMGACLAMLLSIYVPQEYMGLKNGDPGRIAAQVITGVGFLGGGAMIHLKGAVRGLTTAAGIWITSITGMAIGIGMYIPGIIATVLSLLVLMTFEWYEHLSRVGQETRIIQLVADGIITDVAEYRETLEEFNVHLSNFYIDYDYDKNTTTVKFVVLTNPRDNILPMLERMGKLRPTHTVSLSLLG